MQFDAAHNGPRALGAATVYWRLEAGQNVIGQGDFAVAGVALGTGLALGAIEAALADVDRAVKCRLVAGLRSPYLAEPAENDWDVWVYPAAPAAQGQARVVDSVAAALPLLVRGETVLLGLRPDTVRNFDTLPVKFGFSTIFWNTL